MWQPPPQGNHQAWGTTAQPPNNWGQGAQPPPQQQQQQQQQQQPQPWVTQSQPPKTWEQMYQQQQQQQSQPWVTQSQPPNNWDQTYQQQPQPQSQPWGTPSVQAQHNTGSWTTPQPPQPESFPSWSPQMPSWVQPNYQPPPPNNNANGTSSESANNNWAHPEPVLGKHDGVTCDYCGATNISGTRHKCHYCYNYDLCDKCYRSHAANKTHNARHPMEDIAPGQRPGKTLPQRESPVGKYVRRGRDWKWGDQDGHGRGTCLGIRGQNAYVRWANGGKYMYRWGIEDAYDIFIEGVAEAKDLVGCVVRRGPDWKWGDQDESGEGIVEGQPQDGVILVRWVKSGTAFQYRWGVENAYDILVIADKGFRGGGSTITAAPPPPSPPAAPHPAPVAGGGRDPALGPGGNVEDAEATVELSEEEGVKLIWMCTAILKLYLKDGVLKREPDMREATSLSDTYNKVYSLEQAIRFPFFTEEWRSYKYEYWNTEMRSSKVSLQHIASCLMELEMNVLLQAQKEEWKKLRKNWLTLLLIVGGRSFSYPTPNGPSMYNQSTGEKSQEGRRGNRRDMDEIMSQCKMQ